MTILNVVIEGNASRNLARLSAVVSPQGMGVFLNETVARYLRERIARRFDSEGDDVSGKWAPLTDATMQIRANKGYPPAHPINVRTGTLRNYIENSPDRLDIDPTGAMLTLPGRAPTGSLKKKVLGAQQGENRAPARPVLGVNATDMAFTMTALEAFIRSGVGAL